MSSLGLSGHKERMTKYLLIAAIVFCQIESIESTHLFENSSLSIAHVKIMPGDEIGLHYDRYPHMVKAIKGGILTRLEADGSMTKVEFKEGQWVYRPSEVPEKMHRTINAAAQEIELLIIQFR
jgi:quercetin dioxygenase-like cupin family protein